MELGIDEVGRGAWAGPLVFAGAILPSSCDFSFDLKDSKLLSAAKRQVLFDKITSSSIYSISIIDNGVLDKIGLTEASRIACNKIVDEILNKCGNLKIIIDGNFNYLSNTEYEKISNSVVKADANIHSVMAASIVAKQYRDNIMREYECAYPGYDFINNVGYGTRKHRLALDEIGISGIHRMSFEPMKSFS